MDFIAELCQNHNGDPSLLMKMCDEAANAGATYIKMQTIYAANLAFRPQFENGLEVDGRTLCIKRPWKAEYDRLLSLELTDKESSHFCEYVKSLGLTPITTCFARCDLTRILDQGFTNIKIASYDCSSYPMLREVANKAENVIVSTGSMFDEEIEYANEILEASNTRYSFLHCVTKYPTPLEDMNINRLNYLRTLTQNVGFSDHSHALKDGIAAAKVAVYMGASVVERHFTILDSSDTKDGPVSITPRQLKELMAFNNLSTEDQKYHLNDLHPTWHLMLGTDTRDLTHEELLNRDYYRGRFASPRPNLEDNSHMIFNWEEISP